MAVADCLFCKFVAGDIPCHKVYEDDQHLAFLTIFPNTLGATVVIPKNHQDSYFADVEDSVRADLLSTAAKVAKKIDAAFEDVGRTGLIFEGFGVDHLHAKLFPMHGTKSDEWQQLNSSTQVFFDTYQGYLSSHDAAEADQSELAATAAKIANS